jgi:hypothetical protein
MNLVAREPGLFTWKDYDEFILIHDKTITLQTLDGR